MSNTCKVSNNIVTACDSLMEVSEAVTSKRKNGLFEWRYSNMDTGETTRTLFGAKSDIHKTGLIFNFCPYCGVEILKEDK